MKQKYAPTLLTAFTGGGVAADSDRLAWALRQREELCERLAVSMAEACMRVWCANDHLHLAALRVTSDADADALAGVVGAVRHDEDEIVT